MIERPSMPSLHDARLISRELAWSCPGLLCGHGDSRRESRLAYRRPERPAAGARLVIHSSYERSCLDGAEGFRIMSDELYVYLTASIILATVLVGMLRKSFDPFAPHWLFLTGFAQVYVVQAITARDWALRVRGLELVTAANARALWALVWFLVVYYAGPGKILASLLPRPPAEWSPPLITFISPWMILWGLIFARALSRRRRR